MDDWEKLDVKMGICLAKLQTSISFPERQYSGLPWFGKGRQGCVCLLVFSFRGLWGLKTEFRHYSEPV